MKWACLMLLASCAETPSAGVVVSTLGLMNIDIVDLYLIDASTGPATCAELGTAPVALREDITIEAYSRLDAGGLATKFSNLGDKKRLVVAEAFSEDATNRIGFGCAVAPMIERDKATSVIVRVEALP